VHKLGHLLGVERAAKLQRLSETESVKVLKWIMVGIKASISTSVGDSLGFLGALKPGVPILIFGNQFRELSTTRS
jgi:hypothetical protein